MIMDELPYPLNDIRIQFRKLSQETGQPSGNWQDLDVKVYGMGVTNNLAIKLVIPGSLAEIRIFLHPVDVQDMMFDINSLADNNFNKPLAVYNVAYPKRTDDNPLVIATYNPNEPGNHETCRRIVAASFSADTPEGKRMQAETGHNQTNKIQIVLYCSNPDTATRSYGALRGGPTRSISGGSLMQGQQQGINTSGSYNKNLRNNSPCIIINMQFLFEAQLTKRPDRQHIACLFEAPEDAGAKGEHEETAEESPNKKQKTDSDGEE